MQWLGDELRRRGLFWKMAYASPESEAAMNASFAEIPHWNHDQESAIMNVKDYWVDLREAARSLTMPVLYFYGKTDWMVGPEAYREVHFPELMLWGCDVGHVAILENKAGLEQAIAGFTRKYSL